MPRRLPTLERSGRPELVGLEDAIQRVLAGLDASSIPYVPARASDWVSPPPATLQEALDRLAAAGGTTPVP
jgi:hypothetical protein